MLFNSKSQMECAEKILRYIRKEISPERGTINLWNRPHNLVEAIKDPKKDQSETYLAGKVRRVFDVFRENENEFGWSMKPDGENKINIHNHYLNIDCKQANKAKLLAHIDGLIANLKAQQRTWKRRKKIIVNGMKVYEDQIEVELEPLKENKIVSQVNKNYAIIKNRNLYGIAYVGDKDAPMRVLLEPSMTIMDLLREFDKTCKLYVARMVAEKFKKLNEAKAQEQVMVPNENV